jgi:hypothetical protein
MQREMKRQHENQLNELKQIEMQNLMLREQQIIELLLQAKAMKRVKKVPPPLEPLPYHMLPKRIIDDLGLNPPLVVHQNLNKGSPSKLDKQKTKFIEKLNPNVEVYER